MLVPISEGRTHAEQVAAYRAARARRHAAEQAAEARRRAPVVIAAQPLRTHVVTTRRRVQLPAVLMDIRPWEALRPAGAVEPQARRAEPEPRRITIRRVQRATCAYYGVTLSDLISERRTQPLVRHRQVAMYLARKICKATLPEIGRRFGNRDHTTALSACRKIAKLLPSDDRLRAAVEVIEASAVDPDLGMWRQEISAYIRATADVLLTPHSECQRNILRAHAREEMEAAIQSQAP